MRSEPALFGWGEQFSATAEDFMRALDKNYRVMMTRTVDWNWTRTVNLGGYEGRALTMIGFGPLTTNIQRSFEGAPMLCAFDKDWRFHAPGINFLGQMDREGLPASDDDAPLISFAYLDRSSFRGTGFYAGPVNAEFGRHGTMTDDKGNLIPGYLSQTPFDGIECHRSKYRGIDAFGFRKLTFSNECSIERCGLADPSKYEGLYLEGDPSTFDQGQSLLTGMRFEHDDPSHIGLRFKNANGMLVGRNRHMLAGMDGECYASAWEPNTVYPGTQMIRRQAPGKLNDWIGRKQRIVGPWWNRRLEDAPESEFDNRKAA